MAGFQAIDLDAVLDEFESKQDEEEQETTTTQDVVEEPADSSSKTPAASAVLGLPVMTSAAAPSVLESPADEKNSSSSDQFYDVPGSPRQQGVNDPVKDEEEGEEEAASHPKPHQPDVLSPALRSSLLSGPDEIAADNQSHKQGNESSDVPADAATADKSPVYESIYDKYRSQDESDTNSEEEPRGKVAAAAATADEEDAGADDVVTFEAAGVEVRDEDVDALLEELEGETSLLQEVGGGGARPKIQTEDSPPDVVMEATHQQEMKDNNHHSSSNNVEDGIPPPSYNELDPVIHHQQSTEDDIQSQQKSHTERPNSLDIAPSFEKTLEEHTNEQSASCNGDLANNADCSQAENGMPEEVETVAGEQPAMNSSSQSEIPELLQGLSEEQLMLGKVTPFWIPDTEAHACMICEAKFTMVKRRHHCRACGKVLCGSCCSDKFALPILEGKDARVCLPCKSVLDRLDKAEKMQQHEQDGQEQEEEGAVGGTAPSAPPASAAATPSVVPGVLKRSESTTSSMSGSHDPGQVMFSDGVKPGGDLAELDGSSDQGHRPPRRVSSSGGSGSGGGGSGGGGGGGSGPGRGRKHKGHHHHHRRVLTAEMVDEMSRSLIPAGGGGELPPEVVDRTAGCTVRPADPETLTHKFQEEGATVPFALNRNLRVHVTLVRNYAPINKPVWNFKTQGLATVGQDEVVILLIKLEGESLPAKNIFEHLQQLYEQAKNGSPVGNMGHSVILSGNSFLGSQDYGGFLYFRHSYQCLDGLDLPSSGAGQPFLFGLLLTKWEMPWAKVFPLRLSLRLGAESRYYPAPLWSIRGRKTVYREVGNTIMKLLSDFRNFTYSLPIIRGLVIHMEDKLTTVLVPRASLPQIQRALANSNDPVLALGGNFSANADSHLVAVQRDADSAAVVLNTSDYDTQAINIANKSRAVTGASFIVLNGALKTTSGLTAKSSIIEDGIMVQVTQDRMMEVRKQLGKMEDVDIDCGPVGAASADETVRIKWVDSKADGGGGSGVNAGVKSMVDGRPMEGIPSVRIAVQSGRDVATKHHAIRWTEVFIISNHSLSQSEHGDPTRVASIFAKHVTYTLAPHLKQIKHQGLSPFAVKITLDPENTGYDAGSNGTTLPSDLMAVLDNGLVPLLHGQVAPTTYSFELVFYVLDY